jgi:hypothetical protein
MIDLGISARDRRLLVMGASIIGTLFTVARGLPALRDWEQRQLAAASTLAAHLATVRVGKRVLPVLRDSLTVRRARLARLDSTLLGGDSPAAAAADLGTRVEDFAAESSVKVASLQIQSDSVATRAIIHVRVRLVGASDVTGLAAFLRAVEGAETPLVLRELVVGQPDPLGPDSKPETLRIEIGIEGIAIIRPEAKK